MIKLRCSPLFFVLLFILTSPLLLTPALAIEDPIDLYNFPEALGEAFGVNAFAGGILATVIFCVIFMLPVAIWTKTWIPPLVVGIPCLCFCVAVEWLPVWVLFVIAMFIALMFSGRVRDWASGGSTK